MYHVSVAITVAIDQNRPFFGICDSIGIDLK